MRVEVSYASPKKRKIKTLQHGEAFRYGADWYIRVGINDDLIGNFGDFYENHLLTNIPEPSDYSQAVAVLHLNSQHLAYANGEIEADEWCPVVATLKAQG